MVSSQQSLAVQPQPRPVAFSAFRSGSLASVAFRPASWSGRQLVLVAGFRRPASASQFAGRWSARLGLAVRVRRAAGLWAVSVPVAGIPSGQWSGAWVRGGVRGLVRALSLLSSASPERIRAAGGVCSG